jgi:hypothetical protein
MTSKALKGHNLELSYRSTLLEEPGGTAYISQITLMTLKKRPVRGITGITGNPPISS